MVLQSPNFLLFSAAIAAVSLLQLRTPLPAHNFQIRDRVTRFAGVIYNQDINQGVFQSYTVLRDIAVTNLLDDILFEEISIFPMAMATSLIALIVCLTMPKPTGSATAQESGLLIWGASLSAGASALHLAPNMGFKVFETASPAHHQTLKSLEAFEVFYYHDSSVPDKIVAVANSTSTPITLGFDAAGEAKSAKQVAEVLAASGGKPEKLALVLP